MYIISDFIILDFAASLDNFHLITMNIQKVFHENYGIFSKNQVHNFLGVTANGIWENVQLIIHFKTIHMLP